MPLPASGVKTYAQLRPLPGGQVLPAGWLHRYAELNANAWLMHYARNRDPEVYGRFWDRNKTASVTFTELNETQILCDYTAYFADGLAHNAAVLPGSAVAAETAEWMQRLLASQDGDGYLGAFEPPARWQHWLEVFSQSVTLEAVLFHYECTGDQALLAACERAAKLQMQTWYRPPAPPLYEPGIFSGHGTIAIRALLKLYALTGDVGYLNFAQDIMAKYGRTRDFLTMRNALDNVHNAVGCEHVSFPALLYEYNGDGQQLIASRAAWDMLAQHYISVDGTPHGNEGMQFKGPLHNCEHCGTVEWFYTSNALARITGEVKYADAAERVMLNAYSAAKSVDCMTVAYMHTPNQLIASEWSQPHGWTSPDWTSSRQHYHLAHEPLCCNVNGPRALPLLIEAMVYGRDDGLAVVYYGPFEAHTTLPNGTGVTLSAETEYPFEDRVRFTVQPAAAAEFPLFFRIPGWCCDVTLTVNGQPVSVALTPGTYARVQRTWQPGDQVELNLPAPIVLEKLPVSEFNVRTGGVVVRRGPLTFTLPVKEDWRPFTPPAKGPGQGIVAYRLLLGEGAEWNFALVLDPAHPEQSFTPVQLPVPEGARPWEYPPIGLQVRARKVLNWYVEGDPEHPKTPFMPFNPMRLAAEVQTVTLVPFGFTHLRMTYLPVA